jgi:outer membrane protein W
VFTDPPERWDICRRELIPPVFFRPEDRMKDHIRMLGLIMLGMAALHGAPAAAQEHTGSQEVQIYAGEMFGDRLTGTPLNGRYPVLDDDAVFGGSYTYDLTDQWGLQLSAGYSPSRTGHVLSGDANLGLTTLDLDVLWNITPGFSVNDRPLVPYTEVGIGYVWSDLNHPLYGVTGTTPVVLTDSNGYTANAGFGVKYYMTDSFFVDFDARYRYLNRLINNDRQGLNTAQTTLSLGYQF